MAGQEREGVVGKKKLQDLAAEVCPRQLLDEDTEELLMQLADDFIDSVVTSSCQLAAHRKSGTLEASDLQLHLERAWNINIPGFSSSDSSRQQKKALPTEAHKQRAALIKKSKR